MLNKITFEVQKASVGVSLLQSATTRLSDNLHDKHRFYLQTNCCSSIRESCCVPLLERISQIFSSYSSTTNNSDNDNDNGNNIHNRNNFTTKYDKVRMDASTGGEDDSREE